MARTYRPVRRSAPPLECPPPWLWLSVGVLLGICLSILAYVYGILPAPPAPVPAVTPQPVPPPVSAPTPAPAKPASAAKPEMEKAAAATTETPKDSNFQFYDVLPKNSVKVTPDPELRPEDFPRAGEPEFIPESVAAEPALLDEPPPSEQTAGGGMYILQVASFRHRQDAVDLQAYLSDLGFETSIQAATIHGENWFRTRVGPFANEFLARKAQSSLAQNQFNALLMRY